MSVWQFWHTNVLKYGILYYLLCVSLEWMVLSLVSLVGSFPVRSSRYPQGRLIILDVIAYLHRLKKPQISFFSSIGYGVSLGGISAMLTMLNSCAPGVGVVNIDNGFGAAALAYKCIGSAAERN